MSYPGHGHPQKLDPHTIVHNRTIIYAVLVTPPLLPLCEDCDQEPRALRSRRCGPCRQARKATQKATWQRENRDKRRADARPIRISRDQADDAIASLDSAIAALQPLKDHLATRAPTSRAAREHLTALGSAVAALGQVRTLVSPP